jgi:signal transduction histidine kinase
MASTTSPTIDARRPEPEQGDAMRRRITLLAAATAMLAVLLLAVPLGIFVSHGYVNDERLELQRAAASAAASLRGDHPALGALRIDRTEITAAVYDRAGRLIDGTGPARADAIVRAALHGAESTATLGSDVAVAAPISDGDQVIAVVLLRSDLRAAHHRGLLAWLVIAAIGVAAVLVAAGGALLLARRLSAPLERLRHAARRIGAGDLAARAPLSGVAEFDTMAATLNDSAAQIQTMLGRERSLSAEVSHQLRTPLSGLRLELETLRTSVPSSANVESALAAVDRLETIIADVIALARDLPVPQTAGIAELIASAQQRWNGPLAAVTRPLRVIIDPGLPEQIGISTPAATQILDVLLDNARRHGRGAVTIRVRALDGVIAVDVSDEGPALLSEAHVMFRRRDGLHDSGIGLPFARKLAEAENARVALTSHEPPTFSLLATAAGPRVDTAADAAPPQGEDPQTVEVGDTLPATRVSGPRID